MEKVFIVFLETSISMTLIIIFIEVLLLTLLNNYKTKIKYYVWIIILAGLVIPFRIEFNQSIIKFEATGKYDISDLNDIKINRNNENLYKSITYIWLLGSSLSLGNVYIKNRRFFNLAKKWSINIEDKEIIEILDLKKSSINIKKKVKIKHCKIITSPMVINILKPTILIPYTSYTKEELSLIITHELIHIKREDICYKLLAIIVNGIHWFNPIVRFATEIMLDECEMSCDEEVLNESSLQQRKVYSNLILNIASQTNKNTTLLSTQFYTTSSKFKKRIYSIIEDKKKKSRRSILFIPLFMLTISGGVFSYIYDVDYIIEVNNGNGVNVIYITNSKVYDYETGKFIYRIDK